MSTFRLLPEYLSHDGCDDHEECSRKRLQLFVDLQIMISTCCMHMTYPEKLGRQLTFTVELRSGRHLALNRQSGLRVQFQRHGIIQKVWEC